MPRKIRPLQQEQERHLQMVPFRHYRYVWVTFPAANRDVVIEHDLPVDDPEDVRFFVVYSEAPLPLVVFRDSSLTRRPWGPTHIVLRANLAGRARLLLFLEPTDA